MRPSFAPLDFYLLRLPALPISDLWRLHAQREPAALAAALHALYQAPEVQEAIYLASPELYQELLKWLAKPLTPTAWAEDERLLLTLYKYVLRMSSRSTPYGLFAGFSTGRIGAEATQLTLAPAQAHKHARLDMNYVAELAQQVAAEPTLQAGLKLFVNTSLYKTENTYRYYEYRVRNKRRHYYLVAVNATPYLAKVLAAAQPGATRAQLLALLAKAGVSEERGTAFLTRLVEAQVLVSELEPTVTGPEFYRCLVAKVTALSPAHPLLAPLRQIETLLAAENTGVATYQAVQDIIRQSFPAATSKDLIQTDLRFEMTHNHLRQSTVEELSAELSELAALYRATVPPDLKAFAKSFVERYENQEIPLLEALDSEAGLGYGAATGSKTNHTPLIDSMRVTRQPAATQLAWTAYRQLVFRKWQQRPAGSTAPVALTPQDLAALAPAKPAPLPATLYAMGSFVAASAPALDRGEFQFQLAYCVGPGAMPLLARFAHADTELASHLRACGAREQAAAGETLLAEIVHLPEARVGNVLQRPQLREYEIPFLGQAAVPQAQQVPVSDLLVSVRQGRIVLRSKRLNKIIQPRLTSAHNYRNGLAIYRFLCDLQHQDDTFSVLWDWGPLAAEPFLPRIEYKRLIVRRAQWQLPASAHDEVATLGLGAAPAAQLTAFLERYHLPRQVMMAEGDNELLLDFDCPLAAPLLAQRLKKGGVMLTEFVQNPASHLLTDGQGKSYLHEVIIPLHCERAVAPAAPAVPAAGTVQRSFAPGSEWTYLKVYCGAKWADKLLADHLRPCLEELEAQQLVQKWFFIRYNDPHNHLRLRLLHDGSPARLATIIGALHQALAGLQQARVVQAIQYDTYHRELERYGAATMEFSETVFYHDSRAVLQFLNLLAGEEGERYRWLFALRGVDEMLTAFGLPLDTKLRLAEQLQLSFFQEFNGGADLTHQLNDKYRAVSRELAGFLDPAQDTAYTEDAVAVFAERQAALAAEFEALPPEQAAAAQLLLPSYLHMFLNRIFLANQRQHELVVYHYLSKYYKSVAARQKTLVAN